METTHIKVNAQSATHLAFKAGDTVRMTDAYRFCGETHFTDKPLTVLAAIDCRPLASPMLCVDLPQKDGREFSWIPIRFFEGADE